MILITKNECTMIEQFFLYKPEKYKNIPASILRIKK